MSALLLLHWRKHRIVLAALCGGMFVFQWVMTRLRPGPEQAELMRQMITFMPQGLVAALGDDLASVLTPEGFLTFAYSHPFALILMSAWTIRVPSSIAGEIGQGTMDLLASRPVPRAAIVGSTLLVALAGLAMILGAGLSGTSVGLSTRPIEGVGPLTFLPVIITCYLLFAAFAGVALAIATTQRQGGTAIGIATAVVAGSFALDYVARAWQPIKWAEPLSLFHYYGGRRIVAAGLNTGDVSILAVVCLVFVIVAFLVFGRRDL